MNTVLSFLHENRQRFALERYGAHGRLASLVITPRFQASSHVVFMIWATGTTTPVLVAKTPRLVDATTNLQREVANLRLVQARRPAGFASVPQVVAFESYHDYPILVETALVGQPMDPAFTRRHRERCCQAVTTWLIELQQPTGDPGKQDAAWFERLIDYPIDYFSKRFPIDAKETRLLQQTRVLVEPLRTIDLSLTFEHGDLSYPNLMLLPNGEPGVIDWELADPHGLPACDLFLFLTYAAFATHNAGETGNYQAAFQSAFFDQAAWTKSYIQRYAEQINLPEKALTPLFIITWLRYILSQLVRMDEGNQQPLAQVTPCAPATAQWLRKNRYYALWEYAVNHAKELAW